MKINGTDDKIYFGSVAAKPTNWRTNPVNDPDPDDEVLDVTPPDVIAMLGFDPLELDGVHEMALNSTQRRNIVDKLVSNCSCKGIALFNEEDRDVLNAKSDKELTNMEKCMAKVKEMEENAKKKEEDEKEIPRKFKDAGKEYAFNSKTEKWECVNNTMKTTDEWLNEAPAEVQSIVGNALAFERKQREELVAKLTANERCKFTAEELSAKSTSELHKLVDLVGVTPAPVSNWLGASTPYSQLKADALEEPLVPPTINWETAASDKK